MTTPRFALLSPFAGKTERVLAVQAEQFPVRGPMHWLDVGRVEPAVIEGDLTDDEGATFYAPGKQDEPKSRPLVQPEGDKTQPAQAAPLLSPATDHATSGE